MKLTDTACRTAKPKEKSYKLFDGGGLYLEVMPTGSRIWRWKYRFMGKEKRLSFGKYPSVSLKEARDHREGARKTLDRGHDPSEQRKAEKLQRQVEYDNNFEVIAYEWHAQKKNTWKPDHAEDVKKRLQVNAFPVLGARPINAITPQELLSVIRKVEERGAPTLAQRIMQYCSHVFRYAVATGRAERDITADLKGALKPIKSTGYAHLSEKELPAFLKKLSQYESEYNGSLLTKYAFQFMILSFVRSGEIRGAKWDEINWEKKEWHIPAERMKMKEKHIVPLAKQSITLLKKLQEISGDSPSGYIFPSQQSPRKMMSENTFLRAIDIMGYKGKTTGHGFRTTASTILNENSFRGDVIERQLAHAERDQVRAAYNYAEYLKERHEMMQWWADYLTDVGLV